jgi:hypothetical protein
MRQPHAALSDKTHNFYRFESIKASGNNWMTLIPDFSFVYLPEFNREAGSGKINYSPAWSN